MNKLFCIRVTHCTGGFYSFYDVEATNKEDAHKIADRQFYKDFCSSNTAKLKFYSWER